MLHSRWFALAGCAVLLVSGSGCTTYLTVTRTAPPAVSLGVNQVSLDVDINTKNQVSTAVATSLFLGQINIPSDPKDPLIERLRARLPEVGIAVCGPAPCGQAAMRLTVTQSQVGAGPTSSGRVRADARLSVRVTVAAPDGTPLMSRDYGDHEWDRPDLAGELLGRAADSIATQLVSTLSPRQVRERIPLEVSGPLEPGAKLLIAGDAEGAERYLLELAQSQPDVAGTYYNLGVIAEMRGDYGRAATFHRQAVARDPKQLYVNAAAHASELAPAQAPAPAAAPPANP